MKYSDWYEGKRIVRGDVFSANEEEIVIRLEEPLYFDPAPIGTVVKVKKLHSDAVIPRYATPGAAGFDLVAIEDVILKPGETKLVRTGLAFEIPEGYELQIRPRSGLSLKTPLRVANSPGTVDSDYRGEICIIAHNISRDQPFVVVKGDRIAQGVIAPVVRAQFEVVDELSETERGDGGFGSTGTR